MLPIPEIHLEVKMHDAATFDKQAWLAKFEGIIDNIEDYETLLMNPDHPDYVGKEKIFLLEPKV